jgi:toxin CcdB
MAQFDVYETPHPDVPYVVDVQSGFLEPLATRVVIPLKPATSPLGKAPLSRLTPALTIKGQSYYLDTPRLSAVLANDLKQPILSLAESRQTICDALDFLTHGY